MELLELPAKNTPKPESPITVNRNLKNHWNLRNRLQTRLPTHPMFAS